MKLCPVSLYTGANINEWRLDVWSWQKIKQSFGFVWAHLNGLLLVHLQVAMCVICRDSRGCRPVKTRCWFHHHSLHCRYTKALTITLSRMRILDRNRLIIVLILCGFLPRGGGGGETVSAGSNSGNKWTVTDAEVAVRWRSQLRNQLCVTCP